jgi:hypothetical protein
VSKNEAINRLRDELNRLAEVVNDQDAALIDECLNEAMELAKPPADTIPVRVAVAMGFDISGRLAYSPTGFAGSPVPDLEEGGTIVKRWYSSPPTSSRRPPKSKPWMRR